ncbi:MAG: NUDIX domain-containing protein [Candidatus Magasanikbacteria bacterium]
MIQKLFVASKGIIIHDGKTLVLQEGKSDREHVNDGKWQFPGGRLNFGEHPFEGLEREVFEETGLKVKNYKPFFVDHWMPKPFPEENWQIVGVYYLCECDDVSEVKLSHEHKNYAWVNMDNMEEYNFLPQDRKAILSVKEYLK